MIIRSWLTFSTQNFPSKTSTLATSTLMLTNPKNSAKLSHRSELNAKSYLRNKLRKILKRVKLSGGMRSNELASLPSTLTMTMKKTSRIEALECSDHLYQKWKDIVK